MRFNEIELYIRPGQPGLYVINTGDIPLKVGISTDLRRRLIQHRNSQQNGLKLVPGGSWDNPADVLSKRSILAKHLFFDFKIAGDYDLQAEHGRRRFLSEYCSIEIVTTRTKAEARLLEKELELRGGFRYAGKVLIRKPEVVEPASAVLPADLLIP